MQSLIYDLYMRLLLPEYNKCANTNMWKAITTAPKVF